MKPRQPAIRKAGPRKRQPRPSERMGASRPRGSGRRTGRWDAYISALGSWPRVFQLCLILFVAAVVSSGMATLVVMVLKHMLLHGPRA